ncbi:glucosamine kinase [Maritalea myrionectae]|uniref:Glucosamine kinase n=1 Tax=Maritalea myrionectae TaxID=454601 RepID=A0A2R4MIE4_9HYPH|nr:BadF/BadG/BcrA/BcrD ATPase family protein [Maritalea myrionectae]AVX05646.1 glucosamine kinase [Maritalea myrionectae]
MQNLFLGIDGGGTNCRARLADENLNILAQVRGGPANTTIGDGSQAYNSIIDVSHQVFKEAGLSQSDMTRTIACLGLAGAHLESSRRDFAAREYPFAKTLVHNDVETAREGAHLGEDGAVLIVGTGSAGLAKVKGEYFPVGGWGYHISDTASGAILGRALARRSIEVLDGLSEGSPLTEVVIDHLGGTQNSLMAWSFKAWPKDFASLAPFVVEHFEKNDPIALELMQFEFDQIEQFINWFKARGAQKLAIVGGLGERLIPILTERFGDYVQAAKSDAQNGALLMAQKAA